MDSSSVVVSDDHRRWHIDAAGVVGGVHSIIEPDAVLGGVPKRRFDFTTRPAYSISTLFSMAEEHADEEWPEPDDGAASSIEPTFEDTGFYFAGAPTCVVEGCTNYFATYINGVRTID